MLSGPFSNTNDAAQKIGSKDLLTQAARAGKVRTHGRRRDFEAENPRSRINRLTMLAAVNAATVKQRVPVPLVDWVDLEIGENDTLLCKGQVVWFDIVWAFTPTQQQPTPPTGPKNKAGAPAKFHWDIFWVEVIRMANTPDGISPLRRHELHQHMMQFCADLWGDEAPADSTVREKLAKLVY